MTFGHPLLLLALLVVPLAVGLYLLAERRRMRYAVSFTNIDVLAAVAGGGAWRRYVPPAVFLLALAASAAALARPNVNTMVVSDRATVILVIDVSRSMQARDVKPTRLGAAQDAVRTFLDHAPKNLRVGLIAFAGEPQVAAPPTRDHQLVLAALDQIGYFSGFGGTAIGDALARAVELGKQATGTGAPSAGQTIAVTTPPRSAVSILFLSDGAQTRGTLQPLEGAMLAKDAGFPVFTVALGTPDGTLSGSGNGGGGFGLFRRPVPPDPVTLKSIADVTGGKFFEARNAEILQAAYTNLGSSLGRAPGRSEVTAAFLAAAAALLVGAAGLSAVWSPRLP